MAEKSLSPEEFLSKLLADEHADVLREGLAWLVRELMESEVASQVAMAAEALAARDAAVPAGVDCVAAGACGGQSAAVADDYALFDCI